MKFETKESYSALLSYGAIYFLLFYKIKFENLYIPIKLGLSLLKCSGDWKFFFEYFLFLSDFKQDKVNNFEFMFVLYRC